MPNTNIAVKVQDITKTFKIPLEASSGIKQKIINVFKGRKGYREFTPLNKVSFEINEGDFFGIVGRNGSGKSTLLKTIAGIYSPEEGAVTVKGTLVPFIELGVGFNPELSGRENVFLNGALLGFSHKEMEAMYDEIVDFAELHDFMEERLKNYSSGMQVRLAFSIAIQAQGDVLLLDEVLAVGDEAFQRKCFAYFEKLKRNKKTVILVTHDMSSVERFCNKAMMIEDGEIKVIGKPQKVAAAYSLSNDESYVLEDTHEEVDQEVDLQGLKIEICDKHGVEAKKFTTDDEMLVRLTWDNEAISDASVTIVKESGEVVFGTGTYQDQHVLKEKNTLSFKVKLNISEGLYFLKVGLGKKNEPIPVVLVTEGPQFLVSRNKSDTRWDGVTNLSHEWS